MTLKGFAIDVLPTFSVLLLWASFNAFLKTLEEPPPKVKLAELSSSTGLA